MGPMYPDPRTWDTRMEVGPSAAPMMPIEAASLRSNPIRHAIRMAAKIPNWAAAPNKNSTGWLSNGPKSIMAPIPIKSRIGMASEASIPVLNSHSMIPAAGIFPCTIWSTTPEYGRFTSMAPKPRGRRSEGSYSFLTASQIRIIPTTYMTACCQVTAVMPSNRKLIHFPSFVPCPVHHSSCSFFVSLRVSFTHSMTLSSISNIS